MRACFPILLPIHINLDKLFIIGILLSANCPKYNSFQWLWQWIMDTLHHPNILILQFINNIFVMQRNKSKKLYSSFHKAEAKLSDPSKSQLVIKTKHPQHVSHLGYQTAKRDRDSSMILGFEGKSIQSNRSAIKSNTTKNLKIQKDKKGWKQVGYGTSRCNNMPVSNRILKEIINFGQKKKDSQFNQENKDHNQIQQPKKEQKNIVEEEFCHQNDTLTTANNPILQDYSPVPHYSLQIEEFPKMDSFVELSQIEDQQDLIKEKQQITMKFDSLQVAVDEYKKENSIIVQNWISIIDHDKNLSQTKTQIQKIKKSLRLCIDRTNALKTEMFEFTRQFLSKKKIKESKTKNTKENILLEAERAHEELRKKLSSKADYEHVILFNQKVILSGEPHPSFYTVYEEMFEGQSAKKFSLIVKKQLTSLAHYDARLIQDYLKKIQQLQNSYMKVQSKHNNREEQGNVQDYFLELEQKVEIIQQSSIKIDKMESQLAKHEEKKQFLQQQLQVGFERVNREIYNLSEKVGSDYQTLEGKCFNFKSIMEQKFQELFKNFRDIYEEKEEIKNRLQKIQMGLRR